MAAWEGGDGANVLTRVRESTAWVVSQAEHVHINNDAIELEAGKLAAVVGREPVWDADGWHFSDGGPLTVQYLLVVDTINFCFWPDDEMEYEPLVRGLKLSLEADPHALDASRLATCTGEELRRLVGWPRPLPMEGERVRLLRELGEGLLASFEGQAADLVASAEGSAARLVSLLATHFPGFRDEIEYRGKTISLFKRAQIFVGDVWGAFDGKGLGAFSDIHSLTMFADYRVPAVLREMGMISYSPSLASRIDSLTEIESGSPEEVEIRAASIVAVERLRDHLARINQTQVTSLQVDWWLWNFGTAESSKMRPVHHTISTFY